MQKRGNWCLFECIPKTTQTLVAVRVKALFKAFGTYYYIHSNSKTNTERNTEEDTRFTYAVDFTLTIKPLLIAYRQKGLKS
ncbi:hypothetical protein ACQ5SI_26260 [Peribacillus frigoritolerans]|uniref:hypothetical protein n=1 Tax=Peribacillus frigoritolerans TaxID=450367 RepID=UPI003D341C19